MHTAEDAVRVLSVTPVAGRTARAVIRLTTPWSAFTYSLTRASWPPLLATAPVKEILRNGLLTREKEKAKKKDQNQPVLWQTADADDAVDGRKQSCVWQSGHMPTADGAVRFHSANTLNCTVPRVFLVGACRHSRRGWANELLQFLVCEENPTATQALKGDRFPQQARNKNQWQFSRTQRGHV